MQHRRIHTLCINNCTTKGVKSKELTFTFFSGLIKEYSLYGEVAPSFDMAGIVA